MSHLADYTFEGSSWRVSQEQHDNLVKMFNYWLDNVYEDSVDMSTWGPDNECGCLACLGGHAVHSGMFPGLSFNDQGVPVYKGRMGVFVGYLLFGVADIFQSAGDGPFQERDYLNQYEASDYTLAYRRLEIALKIPIGVDNLVLDV